MFPCDIKIAYSEFGCEMPLFICHFYNNVCENEFFIPISVVFTRRNISSCAASEDVNAGSQHHNSRGPSEGSFSHPVLCASAGACGNRKERFP